MVEGALVWVVLIGMLVPRTRYLAFMVAGVTFIGMVLMAHAQGAPW